MTKLRPVTGEDVRTAHVFARLLDAQVEKLRAIAVPVDRPAKTLLLVEGDVSPGLYVVLTGHVKVNRIARSGREQVLTVSGPGQYFNIVPVFDGGPCPANAETLDDVRLLLFPTDLLHQLVRRDPEIGLLLLKDLGGFMRKLVNLIDDLALHSVQTRLARLLLDGADGSVNGQTPTLMTHVEMAAQLGTVREMVGRSLKSFEVLGMIRIERSVLHVVDRDALARYAED